MDSRSRERSVHRARQLVQHLAGERASFTKLMIANRGEIACRIMRAAKALGIPTVAIYASEDQDASHRHLADEAVCIQNKWPATDYIAPYLDYEHIIEVAKKVGADAVHPGYSLSPSPHLLQLLSAPSLEAP